jgi:hypothetical protein
LSAPAKKPAYVTSKYMLRKVGIIRQQQILYSLLRPTSQKLGMDRFVPEYDSSYNMRFACGKCKAPADILEVRFRNDPGSIYFYLGCPKCGATGLRKIDFSSRISHHLPTMIPFKIREKRET